MNKIESLEKEAERLLARFNKYLPNNPDYIHLLVSQMLRTEMSFDPAKGKWTTYKFGGLRRAILRVLAKNKKWCIENANRVELTNNTTSPTPTPLDELLEQERLESLHRKVQELLSSDFLTRTEKLYVEEYYLVGGTFEEIATKFGVSKQAIQFTLKRAMDKLKSYYGRRKESI